MGWDGFRQRMLFTCFSTLLWKTCVYACLCLSQCVGLFFAIVTRSAKDCGGRNFGDSDMNELYVWKILRIWRSCSRWICSVQSWLPFLPSLVRCLRRKRGWNEWRCVERSLVDWAVARWNNVTTLVQCFQLPCSSLQKDNDVLRLHLHPSNELVRQPRQLRNLQLVLPQRKRPRRGTYLFFITSH